VAIGADSDMEALSRNFSAEQVCIEAIKAMVDGQKLAWA